MTRPNKSGFYRYFEANEERLAHETGPWLIYLNCCGREDGIEVCGTWQEADEFRESYCTGTGVASHYTRPREGHVRAGIIRHSELVA